MLDKSPWQRFRVALMISWRPQFEDGSARHPRPLKNAACHRRSFHRLFPSGKKEVARRTLRLPNLLL